MWLKNLLTVHLFFFGDCTAFDYHLLYKQLVLFLDLGKFFDFVNSFLFHNHVREMSCEFDKNAVQLPRFATLCDCVTTGTKQTCPPLETVKVIDKIMGTIMDFLSSVIH